MKRTMLVLSLALLSGLAALLSTETVAEAQRPKPQPTPAPAGCHSKGVEVHTFYGTTEDVLRGMDKLTTDRAASRMYTLVIESSKGAEIRVYEKAEAQGFTVSTWRGSGIGDLRATLDRKMLKTRGSSCAGAEMKQMLAARGMTLRSETVGAVPASSRAAFAPVVEPYRGYLRVTVLDPCEPAATPASVAFHN
ncbi:MAG: hypothetical protein MOB07_02780 [Acidobacteria bacterium]|nr:hypothetical protein [Acidobacteriota bacterium]